MDRKDDLWAYTKEKYDIPDTAKKWVLERIQAAWRRHKKNIRDQYQESKKIEDPTAGKTSFAVVRNDLEKGKNTSEPLSLREFFVATRARKSGRPYKEFVKIQLL